MYTAYKVNRPVIDCTVTVPAKVSDDAKSFTIDEAIRYLLQPISVIVENSLNDAHFLRKISEIFDSSGQILNHEQQMWLQYENAGGCTNIKNYLDGKKSMYADTDIDGLYLSKIFEQEKSTVDNIVPFVSSDHKKNILKALRKQKSPTNLFRSDLKLLSAYCLPSDYDTMPKTQIIQHRDSKLRCLEQEFIESVFTAPFQED